MGAIAPQLTMAAGDIISSLAAPTPYQTMHPYAGSGSANGTMGDLQTMLHLIAPGLLDNASRDVSLPDAVVHNVAPVGGFSLGDVGDLGKPRSLPGLKFGSSASTGSTGTPSPTGGDPAAPTGGIDFPSTHDTSTQEEVDDAGVVDHSIGGQLRAHFGPPKTFDTGGTLPTSAKRQSFTPSSVPSQQGDEAGQDDPTSAALTILRHAAQAA